MIKTYNVAVVDATTAAGEALMAVLETREFPLQHLYPLSSGQRAGGRVEFRDKHLVVKDLSTFDFSAVQLAFFCGDAQLAAGHAPQAARQGCIVIDSSEQFRADPQVPLVVAAVNPAALAQYHARHIIATPAPAVVQLVLALHPLHVAGHLQRVIVSTYQSVSNAGAEAVEELASQTAYLLNGRPVKPRVFAKQIAFNLLPQVDAVLENGYTREEMRILQETRKVLNEQSLRISATAVYVPIFYGDAQVVQIETAHKLSTDNARRLLNKAANIALLDERQGAVYATTLEAMARDKVMISRVRADLDAANYLSFWSVADNLRTGMALNSVQAAEILIKDYL